MKILIKIDRNKCQSVATCVAIAPEIYKLDDEFKADVIDTYHKADDEVWSYQLEVDDKKLEQAINGAKACPYKAIEVYNEKGKKIYPSD